jgi:ABC-type cobalamin/Fe3+-siderophores transport system ATPase subunit
VASKKRVRIFAGPNGSGKSSLFRGFQQEIKEKTGFFVNADEIELKLNQSSFLNCFISDLLRYFNSNFKIYIFVNYLQIC